MGRATRLKTKPVRVISLAPSATEIVFALNAGKRLVAVDVASDYPPAARKLPRIGDFLKPSVEKIISLRPDLIILSSATIDERSLQELSSVVTNVPVFVQRPQTLKDVLRSVRQMGEVLGVEKAASALLKKMEGTITRVQKQVAGRPRPKVFMEVWKDPLMTAGKNTVVDDLITLAGGRNVAGTVDKPFPTYTVESLIAAQPHIYLISHSFSTVADIKKRTGYRVVKAVQTGRIYPLNPDIMLRPTPRLMEGLVALAKTIHPEAFRKTAKKK